MDDPVSEIPDIIKTLCTASPSVQQDAIETYFTPTASFTHPFCRTGSFNGSRWLIIQIYRWYKIMSPHVDVFIDSVSFDEANMLLYVSIHQTFKIWIVPFYKAQPSLVTVLTLTTDPYSHLHNTPSSSPSTKSITDHKEKASEANTSSTTAKTRSSNGSADGKKYYIQSQNDLYQTSEFIKFVLPWSIGITLVVMWQFTATFFCVIGAYALWPITWLLENVLGGNLERVRSRELVGTN